MDDFEMELRCQNLYIIRCHVMSANGSKELATELLVGHRADMTSNWIPEIGFTVPCR